MAAVFGLAGWSGSGKTTLMVRLIPALVSKGLKVSTVKHAHHGFDVDTPGKDSYEHRAAGATEVLVSSSKRYAIMHELRDEAEPTLDELVARMADVDLVIVEGFKKDRHPKIEVFRPVVGKERLSASDDSYVAIATDSEIPEARVPLLDLNDADAVAGFILDYLGIEAGKSGPLTG